MLASFKKHIISNFPFLFESKILIACSGGLDSTVLTYLCQCLKLNIHLAHCNYNLRGGESDADEEFVKKLGSKFDCKVHSVSFDTKSYKKSESGSVQLIARNLRYEWFQSLQKEYEYDHVLTAHHADDNLETFLINLSRGTGLQGLTGIPEKNKSVIRPLLPFTRQELYNFAAEEKLQWSEDRSNQESKYLRNKVRIEIVPKLKELTPNLMDNFMLSQNHLVGVSTILGDYKKNLEKQLFLHEGRIIKIDIKKLKRKAPLKDYLHLLFQGYGFTQWTDLENLVTATSGKKVCSHTHQLTKDRDVLLLSELQGGNKREIYTIEKDEVLLVKPFAMKIKSVETLLNNNCNSLYVDREKLKFPLLLRKWNNGDYFYPLGMKGKKKVSKFYKDEKIDVLSKEKIWLLCSGDDIIWIVGKRADERFKVTNNTKNILKFELH